MKEADLNDLERRLEASRTRRGLAAAGAAIVASLGGWRGDTAQAKPGKNQRDRCKKKGQKCKREAAAYCARWWPAEFETCQYDHNQCCTLRSKCEEADAKRCASHLFWQ